MGLQLKYLSECKERLKQREKMNQKRKVHFETENQAEKEQRDWATLPWFLQKKCNYYLPITVILFSDVSCEETRNEKHVSK